MKKVLFVPGFKDKITTRGYRKVLRAIEGKGYEVEFITIDWDNSTFSKWVDVLEEKFNRLSAQETILAGFSFGAVISLLTASKRTPSELWLFSLSAAFAEDLPKFSKSRRNLLGKRRLEEISRSHFGEIAKRIDCKTLLFVGEKEAKQYPHVQARVEAAKRLINSSELITVPNCGHEVTNDLYVSMISKNV